MRLHSYVVRYDSGFAPNPFYGYCTLATCKPSIRKGAAAEDWVVGCGSNDRSVRRGGHLVYAMRVTGALSFREYANDPRFRQKIPYRRGSRKQSCGDNIYYHNAADTEWLQRDSFHSNSDGSINPDHVARDTGVDRVLISDDFVYFGGYGPEFPDSLRDFHGLDVCKSGIGVTSFAEPELIAQFVHWIRSLNVTGYISAPFEWRMLRG
ncbi:MAG: hypothetical protein AB7O64_07300 [Methylibium sp.]